MGSALCSRQMKDARTEEYVLILMRLLSASAIPTRASIIGKQGAMLKKILKQRAVDVSSRCLQQQCQAVALGQ